MWSRSPIFQSLVVFLELQLRSSSSTFQLLVKVFKGSPQDRIQRRLAEIHEMPYLVVVLETLTQDRV